jgi:outer membrane protein assembly factor BamE (lipoprotein component of BamABCDE complex)
VARKRFDGDAWYYTSAQARQTVCDFGVEQSLYLDDLEARTFISQDGTRRQEFDTLARTWFAYRKQQS